MAAGLTSGTVAVHEGVYELTETVEISATCGPPAGIYGGGEYVITVSGEGWYDGGRSPDNDIDIEFQDESGDVLRSTTHPMAESWTVTLTVPAQPEGWYVIEADQFLGTTGGGSAPSTVVERGFAVPCRTLTTAPTCVAAYTPARIFVDGAGFDPGDAVQVEFEPRSVGSFGGSTPTAATGTSVDTNGEIHTYIDLPYGVERGGYALRVWNDRNDFLAETPFEVPCPPPTQSVELSQTCGHQFQSNLPGAYNVTVSGDGWDPSGGSVVVTFRNASQPSIASATAPPGNSFSVTLTVPAQQEGLYWIAVTQDNLHVERPFAVRDVEPACPTVTVEPVCGASGAATYEITVTGVDFAPDEFIWMSFQPETVYDAADQDSNEIAGEEHPGGADANGAFQALFTVPGPVPNGEYAVRIYDDTGGSYISEAPFDIPCREPTLTVIPDCGAPGDPSQAYQIQLQGTNWSLSGTIVFTFETDGGQILYTEEMPADDAWTRTFTPPRASPGSYRVVASQDNAGIQFVREFLVPCPNRQLRLEPLDCGNASAPQYTMDLIGQGFVPGAFITLQFERVADGAPLLIASASADAAGTFDGTITVPAQPAGAYAWRAYESGSGLVAETPFTVPCPPGAIKIVPVCGAPRIPGGEPTLPYSLSVVGSGYRTWPVEISVEDELGGFETFTVAPQPDGSLNAVIQPAARAPGEYDVFAFQGDRSRGMFIEAATLFTVPCERFTPNLRIVPDSGPPGFVTYALGSGFPANITVSLTWSDGTRSVEFASVAVGADGAFRRQLMIFHQELAGPRNLTVGPDLRWEGSVDAGFIVVWSPAQPAQFVWR